MRAIAGQALLGKSVPMWGTKHERAGRRGPEEHGDLAAAVDGVAAVHEEAGERAASDGADGGDDVDGDDERILGVVEVEAVVAVEELGEIEEIEPPDAVGEAFGDGEGVEAFVAATSARSAKRADLRPAGTTGSRSLLGLGGWRGGACCRGTESQTMSQRIPMEPVVRKAACQP